MHDHRLNIVCFYMAVMVRHLLLSRKLILRVVTWGNNFFDSIIYQLVCSTCFVSKVVCVVLAKAGEDCVFSHPSSLERHALVSLWQYC